MGMKRMNKRKIGMEVLKMGFGLLILDELNESVRLICDCEVLYYKRGTNVKSFLFLFSFLFIYFLANGNQTDE